MGSCCCTDENKESRQARLTYRGQPTYSSIIENYEKIKREKMSSPLFSTPLPIHESDLDTDSLTKKEILYFIEI